MTGGRGRMATRAGWLFLLAGLASCGPRDGHRIENLRPHVRLTGGPADGDSVSYTSEFLWTGWDQDGVIDHYQYAIDIPDSLQDEVDTPAPTGIAWVDTSVFRASFLFRTPTPDSALGLPIARFRGDHTFYVRAIDNEGAVSTADYLSFTARTVTPRTTFTVPRSVGGVDVLQVGRQFNCAWESIDPDNPAPTRPVARFEWKLKQMPPTWSPIGADAQYAVDYFAANDPWIPLSADTATLRLSLQTGRPYIFAVRGVDEAGGVETRFFKGKNVVILDSSEANPGTPSLTVTERNLGVVEYPGADLLDFEVALRQVLRFQFSATADVYGGVIQGFNYGVDVPDPELDGPTSGFRGWSLNPFSVPIMFTTPGVHTFSVKVRDTGGGVTYGTMIIRAVELPFSEDLLLIDDFRRARVGSETDAVIDTRHLEMLEAAGFPRSRIRQMDLFGPGDTQADPTLPRLSELGAYRLVVWSVLGSGLSRNCGLVQCNACATNRILQAYVAGGGALWVFGQYPLAGFKAVSAATCLANVVYGYGDRDNPSLSFGPREFLYEFMHIDGGEFRDAKNAVDQHGLIGADPSARGIAEGYPPLTIDRTIFPQSNQGIPNCDAMFSPTLDPTGGLDTLYQYVAMRTMQTEPFRGKPTGFRFHDPDPEPRQGPVALFGFPLHYLQNGSVVEGTGVHGMARLMVEWLRQHQRVGG